MNQDNDLHGQRRHVRDAWGLRDSTKQDESGTDNQQQQDSTQASNLELRRRISDLRRSGDPVKMAQAETLRKQLIKTHGDKVLRRERLHPCWTNLPLELKGMILAQVTAPHNRYGGWTSVARVNREFESAVARANFRDLSITHWEIESLGAVVQRYKPWVRRLSCEIQLDLYGCSMCYRATDGAADREECLFMVKEAFENLGMVLEEWPQTDEGLTLALNVFCPSDREHFFKTMRFRAGAAELRRTYNHCEQFHYDKQDLYVGRPDDAPLDDDDDSDSDDDDDAIIRAVDSESDSANYANYFPARHLADIDGGDGDGDGTPGHVFRGHTDPGIHHMTYPGPDEGYVVYGHDDPSHGWYSGKWSRAPPPGAVHRLFSDISDMHDHDPPLLEPMPAVTRLVIRRQMRRHLRPPLLRALLGNLPMLRSLIYEPWRALSVLDRMDMDIGLAECLGTASTSMLKKLRYLTLFEDFSRSLELWSRPRQHLMAPLGVRDTTTPLAVALCRQATTLVRLSASYMIDGLHFFNIMEASAYQCRDLEVLALTSPTMGRGGDGATVEDRAAIDLLLRRACEAVHKCMPSLRLLVLWFGDEGVAAAFVYRCDRTTGFAEISWRGTYDHDLDDAALRAEWVAASGDRCTYVDARPGTPVHDEVRDHAHAISLLELPVRVVGETSLQHMLLEDCSPLSRAETEHEVAVAEAAAQMIEEQAVQAAAQAAQQQAQQQMDAQMELSPEEQQMAHLQAMDQLEMQQTLQEMGLQPAPAQAHTQVIQEQHQMPQQTHQELIAQLTQSQQQHGGHQAVVGGLAPPMNGTWTETAAQTGLTQHEMAVQLQAHTAAQIAHLQQLMQEYMQEHHQQHHQPHLGQHLQEHHQQHHQQHLQHLQHQHQHQHQHMQQLLQLLQHHHQHHVQQVEVEDHVEHHGMFALVHAPIDGLDLEEPFEVAEVVEVDAQEAETPAEDAQIPDEAQEDDTQAEVDDQEAGIQAEDARVLDEVQEAQTQAGDAQEAQTQAEIDAQEAQTQAEVDAQILGEAQAAVDAAESEDADGSASETVDDSQGDAASPTVDGEDTPTPGVESDDGVPSTP